jgi:excisionase family DNA binding protein
MSLNTPHLLTVSAFCEAVGISRSTWHKLKRNNQIPPVVKIGGIQRIRREAVESWLAENESKKIPGSPAIH